MTNCPQDAARRGWELYRASTPPPPLETINTLLGLSGLAEISPRMYKHYRRMAQNGLERYLPINEIDVTLKMRRAG